MHELVNDKIKSTEINLAAQRPKTQQIYARDYKKRGVNDKKKAVNSTLSGQKNLISLQCRVIAKIFHCCRLIALDFVCLSPWGYLQQMDRSHENWCLSADHDSNQSHSNSTTRYEYFEKYECGGTTLCSVESKQYTVCSGNSVNIHFHFGYVSCSFVIKKKFQKW